MKNKTKPYPNITNGHVAVIVSIALILAIALVMWGKSKGL